MRYRFWPFSRQAALLATLVLLPTSIAVAIWLHRSGYLAGTRLSGWTLLGAILIGLSPLLLLVLSGVGSVEAAGVKVAFAAVQEVVLTTEAADSRTRLAQNLGQPAGVPVQDTAGDTIIQSLRDAVVDDVVVVDLKEGHAWWETRLLLLAAGAVRLGYPKAVAFTAAVPGKPRKFLGWASPGELLRRHLAMSKPLRDAYEKAQRDVLLWQLSTSEVEGSSGQRRLPWAPAGNARSYLAGGADLPPMGEAAPNNQVVFPWPSADPPYPPAVHTDDSFLPERLLLNWLATVENPDERQVVTQTRLEELFSPVLHIESVDRDETEERWLTTIFGTTGDYFAVTADGQFNNLVPRWRAVNAALLSVVSGRSRGTASSGSNV